MKVAIIGASLTGLACALEFEKLGIIPDLYERDATVGWIWPSVSFWPNCFYKSQGDIRKHLREDYGIDIKPLGECKNILMKSPKQRVNIDGFLGYYVVRGKGKESIENQLLNSLRKAPLHLNQNADCKELSKKYDWVVAATGNDLVARELNLWEDIGLVRVIGGVALESFNPDSSTIYFNTEYAGTGYGRVTPFNSTQAMVALYIINCTESDMLKSYSKFLEQEGLANFQFLYKVIPEPFTTGRVKAFTKGNILLAGRAAGLTERLIGVGGPECMISGVLAARSIVQGLDYDALLKPLRDHIENISAFRDTVNTLDNDGFDKLLASINIPGVKQLIYKTPINFADIAGSILKRFNR